MENMYREIILDYYRHPRNKEKMDDADIFEEDYNAVCGDSIGIYIKLNGKTIKKISFTGKGCAISQAAVSMLCESIEGKSIDDAKKLTKDNVLEMLGVHPTPARLKCALHGLNVLHKAVYEYEKRVFK